LIEDLRRFEEEQERKRIEELKTNKNHQKSILG